MLREVILARIRQAPVQFNVLRNTSALGYVHFRHVDRELQKLRREGLILYDRAARVWRAVQ